MGLFPGIKNQDDHEKKLHISRNFLALILLGK